MLLWTNPLWLFHCPEQAGTLVIHDDVQLRGLQRLGRTPAEAGASGWISGKTGSSALFSGSRPPLPSSQRDVPSMSVCNPLRQTYDGLPGFEPDTN